MGDLECGFEKIQGVKLGYLLIKGKQMFALSQVFTDLLKNIPRTTVHKRMDHLNVKKHNCDLEELRKLKAINSIAFHAAKCTLISREDVEALYFSCKTERVLKSNKRKVKASFSPRDAHEGHQLHHQDKHVRLWKEKVWFSLVPHQTLPLINNKAGRMREVSVQPPDSNLPQIYNTKQNKEYSSVAATNGKPFKNYETAQITGNRIAINQGQSFFRSVVSSRQPVLFQSAITAQLSSAAASDLLHKRKRRRGEGGGGRDSATSAKQQLWSRSRHTHHHHPPVLIVQPKCCSNNKPKRPSNESLGTFHIGHEFYLDSLGPQHHHQSSQESCSSDSEESSLFSEQQEVNNDSDFGSSLSTISSNSGTSEDEEEEGDSPSESSEVSSDESSSQSDSSSVTSQVSVQSIRFRRARFASLHTNTLNTKVPLVLQPTFHYSHQQQTPHRTLDPGGKTDYLDYGTHRKHERYDSTNREVEQNTVCEQTPQITLPTERESFLTETRGEVSEVEPVNSTFYAQGLSPYCLSRRKVFPPSRTTGHTSKCSPELGSQYYGHVKDNKKHLKATTSHFSVAINLKKETKNCPSLGSIKNIKSESGDELSRVSRPHFESDKVTKTDQFVLQNVKIKVEESYDEYEYSGSGFQCKGDKVDINNVQYPNSSDIKQSDYLSYTTNSESSSRSVGAPTPPTRSQECRSRSTQRTPPRPEEGEYKNGARVRKNYRTLVLGKNTGISRTQHKPNVFKVDKTPCSHPTGKAENCEDYSEDLSGAVDDSKRKRAFGCVAPPLKKPFSFMANFPSAPSLVVGSDGDLSPAYSLNSLRDPRPPPRSHPVWSWQPGGQPVPPPPAQRSRKC